MVESLVEMLCQIAQAYYAYVLILVLIHLRHSNFRSKLTSDKVGHEVTFVHIQFSARAGAIHIKSRLLVIDEIDSTC